MYGTEDPRATINQADTVFQNLGSSEKRFEYLTGVGHESYLAADPDKWKRIVSDFLRNIKDRPSMRNADGDWVGRPAERCASNIQAGHVDEE